jgi:hypothetical protein
MLIAAARKASHRRQLAEAQTEARHDDVRHHREHAEERRSEAAVAEERAKRAKVEAELDEERARSGEEELKS